MTEQLVLTNLSDAAALTSTGLEFQRDLSFNEWEAYGKRLKRVQGAVLWWIGDWWRYGDHRYGERAAQALDPDTWAFQTFMNAGWVASKIETSRRREVLSFSHHAEVAALEPEDQEALLGAAEKYSWNQKELRQAVRKYKRQLHDPSDLPPGVYDLIIADPPWTYENEHVGGSRQSGAVHHYPTMSLDELKHLEVESRAAENSVLLLWATAPLLPEALELIEAWGFSYRTGAVWDKELIGMGYWFRVQHEHLLVAVRGQPHPPEEGERRPSVIREPRRRHSQKPDWVYEWVERAFPTSKRLELFARAQRQGWDVWGNEVAA